MSAITFIFFIIALIYSSVGFGGGSSYLAILSISGMSYVELPLMALLCNLIVVTHSSFKFYKSNLINWQILIPLLLLSVPFTVIGAQTKLAEKNFLLILALILFLASLKIFIDYFVKFDPEIKLTNKISRPKLAILGSVLGFMSGMVGIGGGIFLSPILYLKKLASPQEIAAISSVFIWFNSIAGIFSKISTVQNPDIFFNHLPLLIAVFCGGFIGNRWCVLQSTPKWLGVISSLLTFIASLMVFNRYLLLN